MATREEYTSCVAEGMRGKKLSVGERRLEFCTVAKLCSGKAEDREEAIRLCNEPKPEKAPRARKTKCPPCPGAEVAQELATCQVKLKEAVGKDGLLHQLANATMSDDHAKAHDLSNRYWADS